MEEKLKKNQDLSEIMDLISQLKYEAVTFGCQYMGQSIEDDKELQDRIIYMDYIKDNIYNKLLKYLDM